ncbi:MAG: hypothetical protein AAF656_13385, partial [Planctomycetota bacterium]
MPQLERAGLFDHATRVDLSRRGHFVTTLKSTQHPENRVTADYESGVSHRSKDAGPLGLSVTTWVQIGIIAVLFVAVFHPNLT